MSVKPTQAAPLVMIIAAVAPTGLVPNFPGQFYFDTNTPKLYIAKANTADSDWVALN